MVSTIAQQPNPITNRKTTDPTTLVLDPDLEVEEITEGVYLHRSWLHTDQFGRVPCNGLVVIDEKEALVLDTPPTDELSETLIKWVTDSCHAEVEGVFVGHFHNDSMGGLGAFSKHGIPSYSSTRTQELAKEKGLEIPAVGFDSCLTVPLGDSQVEMRYFGPGHSPDNSVTYLPEQQVLFGGCLIKAEGAGPGNLEDADVKAWPNTVKKLKAAFPETKIVVPGHGDIGTESLLDYTIELFKQG